MSWTVYLIYFNVSQKWCNTIGFYFSRPFFPFVWTFWLSILPVKEIFSQYWNSLDPIFEHHLDTCQWRWSLKRFINVNSEIFMILLFLFSLNFWINAFYIHFNTFDPSKSLSRTFLKSKHIFPHWKCAFQIVCTFHQIVAQVQSAKPSLLSLSALIDCQTQFTAKYT